MPSTWKKIAEVDNTVPKAGGTFTGGITVLGSLTMGNSISMEDNSIDDCGGLLMSGDIDLDGNGFSGHVNVTGNIRATGDVTAYFSDERLKDFHGTIKNAIDKVMSLNGYYFTENSTAKLLGYDNPDMQVGVSAQEVEKILPEIIKVAPISKETDREYKTLDYAKLVPLLIESIKDLKQEINELKDGITG